MMSICVEELPLFGSRQGLYPSGTIDPSTTNLTLVVVETFHRFLQRCLAVVIGTSPKLYGLGSIVSADHAQQLLIHRLLP